MSTGKLKLVDLFCGGGLAGRGYQDAGIEVIAGIERDEQTCLVHEMNFKGKTKQDDCLLHDYRQYGGVDILHASPSCVQFSQARRSTEDHPDGMGALAVIKAARECRPRWIVIENVQGFLKSFVWLEIKRELSDLGYIIWEEVVNAHNYGVPQNRVRAIIVARLGALVPEYRCHIKGTGWYEAVADLLPKCREVSLAPWQKKILERDLPKLCPPQLIENYYSQLIDKDSPSPTLRADKQGMMRVLLPTNKSPLFNPHCIPEDEPCPTIRAGKVLFRALVPNAGAHRDTVRVFGESEPSPTVRTGADHSHLFDAIDGMQIKALSVRCLARLQSVPDNFRLPDRKGLGTKIIGNGVPCKLTQFVGEMICSYH